MSGPALDDLAHELQLLLGADEIVRFIEAHDTTAASDADRFGNLVNYFKDSIYLHATKFIECVDQRVRHRNRGDSVRHHVSALRQGQRLSGKRMSCTSKKPAIRKALRTFAEENTSTSTSTL